MSRPRPQPVTVTDELLCRLLDATEEVRDMLRARSRQPAPPPGPGDPVEVREPEPEQAPQRRSARRQRKTKEVDGG
jgi:hypothetical protein